jgi:SAM-dependent methyltransferase
MNFSPEWDQRYRENTHLSRWPWSDLVSYVFRHARPDSPSYHVLEVGVGAGANIPFFKALGAQFFGIDGSEAIVADLKKRHPEFEKNLVVGDFTSAIPFAGPFDLVVDRASLTANSTAAIRSGLKLVHGLLKPGGKFIGIDWYSTQHSEYAKGKPAEDANTRTGFTEGQYKGLGRVHFSDRAHLEDLFRDFELLTLEHKTSDVLLPAQGFHFAAWNLAARKK